MTEMRLLMTLTTLMMMATMAIAQTQTQKRDLKTELFVAQGWDSVPSVDLDLDNASVRDALKQIFDRAKQEYVVDADVPQDSRITVRARKIKLATALDLVTQATGVGWARERRDSRTVYRIGKSVSGFHDLRFSTGSQSAPFVHFDSFYPVRANALLQTDAAPYLLQYGLERSQFTCPHCKGQATMVSQRQQPKCTKCARVFQRDWQFCPADGARRPPSPGEWRFCPLCGKEVQPGALDRPSDSKSAAP
jgi:hypothetical protein